MGYRLFVVLCAVFMIAGCSAFDSDNTPYTDWSPDLIPPIPGGKAGIHSGFYSGTKVLDSNSCASIADELGMSSDFAINVLHVDNYLNTTLEDGSVMAGELVGDSAIFVMKEGSVEQAYYLTFSNETESVTGNLEVIEPNESGQYGEPCAQYTISLEEGSKPEGFGTGAVVDDTAEDDGSDDGSGEEDGDVDIPLETSGY
jgi:hypothetical protein